MYHNHYKYVSEIINQALDKSNLDGVLIYSGHANNYFLDDMPYAFACNPHFKWMVPIIETPYCIIHYKPGEKAKLYLFQPQDYWHSLPKLNNGEWSEFFDIIPIASKAERPNFDQLKNHAWIGQNDSFEFKNLQHNPKVYMNYVHYHRAVKTDYEIDNIRAANKRALKGHDLAQKAFFQGWSEFEIHSAYLEATKHNEYQLPYGNIIAQNENAAVLHYHHMQRGRLAKKELKTFLIDAGASVNGYASDITRTYAFADNDFKQMIEAVDQMQKICGSKAIAGQSYVDLHQQAHVQLAEILRVFDVIKCDARTAVESGLSNVFFPHGLGHYLGLQVHDIGGHQKDEDGNIESAPELHPYLRLTRTLEENNVITIEPGIYFIDMLLEQAKNKEINKFINWTRVDDFKPFGGIRIEDNIVVKKEKPINLTREF
jgi:Xaa-Pro dipeptidase